MKIDLQTGGIGAYRKKTGVDTPSSRPESSARAAEGKTDVMDIAHGSSSFTDKKLVGLKAGIQSHISSPTSPERIEALKESVRNGTYRISTDELAGAILDF